MRASIGWAVVLLGALGIVTGAAGVPGKQFEAPCNLENKSVPFLIFAEVADMLTAAQALLAQIQLDVQEEKLMFIMDVPPIPAQEPPVIVADATVVQSSAQKFDRVIGVCHLSANPYDPASAVNSMSPPLEVKSYYRNEEQFNIEGPASVSVLQTPAHGTLVDDGGGDYVYYPEKGYLGNDRATLLVEMGGKKVRMEYFFRVMTSVHEGEGVDPYEDNCPQKVPVWKISAITDAYGNNFITAVDYRSPTAGADATFATNSGSVAMDTASLTAALGTNILNRLTTSTSGVTVNLADLAGAAVGQTTGSTITLDTNAAGYNWFIDSTPGDNSEFLPTSNPNEWVAKEGSAAYGKMDMLSVLLHEYGHALGIDHSADSHDYMATTLTAGVRRMPSADELALMQQLVGQVKAGLTESTALSSSPSPASGRGEFPGFPTLPLGANFIGFLGLLRSSRYGGVSIAPDASTLVTKYAIAANATLTNGSLNAADGWSAQGSVDIGPSTGSGQAGGAAVMREVSGSQTRLSQVFMVNDRDRFLSFTLAGTALDNLTGAPDDAFEVALLDANTGASLLGGTGLTRSDAFLNLQADGTQNAASCVTCINNADGSRTYRVDLAGIAAGTAVNLSFDLIGFGQNGSHVTVRDVRLSGLPQLHDEAATMLEDGALAFNPLAQVDNAALLMLGSHVVDQPAHACPRGTSHLGFTPIVHPRPLLESSR